RQRSLDAPAVRRRSRRPRPAPFSSAGDPRDLRSFPTRRSSDLYQASKSAFDIWFRSVAPDLNAKGITTTTIYFPLVKTPMIQPTDRKSTRLNSSHVKISYAVFCLKKKTQKPPLGPRSPARASPP